MLGDGLLQRRLSLSYLTCVFAFVGIAYDRVLSRPWRCDPFLTKVLHELVEKEKSFTKLITYSQPIKEMFAANKEKCHADIEVSKALKDFAYSPVRFNSEAKALVRMVLTFDACLTTLGQVVQLRGATSTEGAAALETLSFIDTEVAVQLGMMAEAAREGERFVQSCDARDFDEGELPSMADNYETTLTRLFCKGLCLEIPGLTQLMIKALGRPKTYIVRGEVKTIGVDGPVDPAIVKRCLGRMASFTFLASTVIGAEFADWDLMSSFQVFALAAGKNRRMASALRGNTNC